MEQKIHEHIGEMAALLQLMEEAAELIQAAHKVIRAEYMTENPTPLTVKEARRKLDEEVADTCLCIDVAGLQVDEIFRRGKMERWLQRLEEKNV